MVLSSPIEPWMDGEPEFDRTDRAETYETDSELVEKLDALDMKRDDIEVRYDG